MNDQGQSLSDDVRPTEQESLPLNDRDGYFLLVIHNRRQNLIAAQPFRNDIPEWDAVQATLRNNGVVALFPGEMARKALLFAQANAITGVNGIRAHLDGLNACVCVAKSDHSNWREGDHMDWRQILAVATTTPIILFR